MKSISIYALVLGLAYSNLVFANNSFELIVLVDDSSSMTHQGLTNSAKRSLAKLLKSTASEFQSSVVPSASLYFMNRRALMNLPHPFTEGVSLFESSSLTFQGNTFFLDPLDKIALQIGQSQDKKDFRVFVFTDGRPSDREKEAVGSYLRNIVDLSTVDRRVSIQFVAFGDKIDHLTRAELQKLEESSDHWPYASFKLVLVNSAEELSTSIESYSEVVSLQKKIDRLKEIVARLRALSEGMSGLGEILGRIDGVVTSESDLTNAIVIQLDDLLNDLGSLEREYMQLLSEFSDLMADVLEEDQSLKDQVNDFESIISSLSQQYEQASQKRYETVGSVGDFYSRVYGEEHSKSILDGKGIPSRRELQEGESKKQDSSPSEKTTSVDENIVQPEDPSNRGFYGSGNPVKMSTSRDRKVMFWAFDKPQLAEVNRRRDLDWMLKMQMEFIRLQFQSKRIRSRIERSVNQDDLYRIAEERFDQAMASEDVVFPSESLDSEYEIVTFGSLLQPIMGKQIEQFSESVLRLQSNVENYLGSRILVTSPLSDNPNRVRAGTFKVLPMGMWSLWLDDVSSELKAFMKDLDEQLYQLQLDVDEFEYLDGNMKAWAFRVHPDDENDGEQRRYQVYDALNDRVITVSHRFSQTYSRSRSILGQAMNRVSSLLEERSLIRTVHIHALEHESASTKLDQSLNDFLNSNYSVQLRLVSMDKADYDEIVDERIGKMLSLLNISEQNSNLNSCHKIVDQVEKLQPHCN